MSLHTAIQQRYSLRHYASTPLSQEVLEQLLECARLAPSAVNYQPWQFVVVTGEEGRKKLVATYPREWFATAPAYIVVLADHSQSWKRSSDGKDHADIDAAIAAEHIALAVTDHGLGCCWVCNFDPLLLREAFDLPAHIEPVVILSVGYPAPGAIVPEKKRKPLNEIVSWENYQR